MNILKELQLVKEKLSKLENEVIYDGFVYSELENAIDHIDEAIKELEV